MPDEWGRDLLHGSSQMKGMMVLTILYLFLFPRLASADYAAPFSLYTIPIIPIIIGIETLVIWCAFKKKYNIKHIMITLLKFVSLANIFTSLMGTLFPIYMFHKYNLLNISICFILSLLIEWIIYIPCFRKYSMKFSKIPFSTYLSDLLKVTFVANLITYVLIASFVSVHAERIQAERRPIWARWEMERDIMGSLAIFAYDNNGRPPTEEEGLKTLYDYGLGCCKRSQLGKEGPQDPWKRPYIYRYFGDTFEIITYGADGAPGGRGDNRDITLTCQDGGDNGWECQFQVGCDSIRSVAGPRSVASAGVPKPPEDAACVSSGPFVQGVPRDG
jgi:general secretion pathway protein G